MVGSGIDVSYNTFLQQTRPKIIELGVRFPQPHQIIKVQQLAEEKSGEFTRVTTKSYNKVPCLDVQYVAKGFRVVGSKKEYAIRLGKILKIKNYKRIKTR